MSTPKGVIYSIAERTGKLVDLTYSSLVHQLGLTPPFFKEGLGQLDVVDFHNDLVTLRDWLPTALDDPDRRLDWVQTDAGRVGSRQYRVYRASFESPVARDSRAAHALPAESRTAHALWIAPDPLPGQAPGPCTLQLAATGDHGFARRTRLGLPLVEKGIGTIALESPYYGLRKPAQQRGAKLARVSDLLLLGRATIEEGALLLDWLRRQGHGRLGVGGLSMGGVHASMGRGPEVREQLARAGRATDALRAARYLLDETDGETARTGVPAGTAPGRAAEARGSEATGTPGTEVPSPPGTADGGVWAGVGGLAERLLKWVAMLERREEHAAAVALLAQVLEAFTDVSRFPRRAGKGGEAAIVVGATEDAYVCREAVLDLHHFLEGSEVRWVPGGHVSSFLLHQEAFRSAIADSLARLPA
ncbi:Uncharacterized protein C4orf29 [Auxenochlorella protothecoides]|uniref:Uncharacterized protein C4orf29 n=1 Tax=Auxenochlorella protothecoides TaxID=3075 RepID=A0A087SD71_AUXPR|nr:Uncharacterized protein C4orf29 [Auxenochlorella protothecoides]KFM23675.1 Uncharacterized protein C4orf29 [Auxenochlorella protothecoides]